MSNARIQLGQPPDPEAPAGRLDADELSQLRRLLAARVEAMRELRALENEVQLLLYAARDRRGLPGRIDVDPETGALSVSSSDDGSKA